MKQWPGIVLVAVTLITGWVAIDSVGDDPPTPSVALSGSNASGPPARVAVPEPGVAAPAQPTIDPYRPVLATTYGRTVDTDGLDAASFLAKVTPAARTGDAAAAYRVYQAEAMCASLERLTRMDVSRVDVEDRAAHTAYVGAITEACAGVTPAQVGERFTFLDQAIRAGNALAMIDYCVEGPNGRAVIDLDPGDPLVVAWKQNANTYLQQLAVKGDQDAWLMLAQDYENGIAIERDLGAALTWWTAIEVSRKPDADPLTVDFLSELAKQLTAVDAQQAIAQGRALGLQFPRRRRSA